MLRNFLSFLPRSLPTIALQRSFKTVTSSSGLVVRKLKKTDTAIIDRLNREFVALGWKYGAEDLQCYLDSSIYPGVSIAELDGDLVASIAVNKYSDSLFTIGLFMVVEKYKGKGYGLTLVKTASEEVDFSQIVSANAAPEMVTKYEKLYGIQPRWFVTKYLLDISTAFEVLNAMPSVMKNNLTVHDLDHVDEGALLSYDASVFGYQRNRFTSTWIHSKGNHVKVVVNGNKDIVGYIVARPAYMKQDGYCLRPLFADSTEAAQLLLTAVFEEILVHDPSCSHTVYIDCPNINASTRLMKVLYGKPISHYVFMSTNDIPKGQFMKWFGRP